MRDSEPRGAANAGSGTVDPSNFEVGDGKIGDDPVARFAGEVCAVPDGELGRIERHHDRRRQS